MRIFYCFLLYLLVPFVLLRLLWRSRKAPAYKKRWGERFGFFKFPVEFQNGIWIHVVSVGEVIAAAPLVYALLKQYPNLKLTITTMTPTGSERVRTNLPADVFHVYTPYDLPGAVKRFLNKVKPKLLILMETELWPNMLYNCKARNIPCLLANARLSAKSAKGYNYFQPLTKQMIHCLSIIAAQAQPDAKRFLEIGASEQQINITGNIKFDLQVPASLQESAEMLRQKLGAHRPLWVVASTHDGEDEKILRALKKIKAQIPDSLLILVPRHPERFNKVAQLCKKEGYQVVRRSQNISCNEQTDIFLGDTIGELRLFFGAADLAFIGGSLVPRGGHNMLEAAAFSLPVITGPHLFNFMEVSRLLQEANALITVNNHRELAEQVIKLMRNASLRQKLGERCKKVVESNRGALEKHLAIIKQLLH